MKIMTTLFFPLIIGVGLFLAGCAKEQPPIMKKVVAVGICKDTWGGCMLCGVQYEDKTGGLECSPIVGTMYPVFKR